MLLSAPFDLRLSSKPWLIFGSSNDPENGKTSGAHVKQAREVFRRFKVTLPFSMSDMEDLKDAGSSLS
jgi:hypothetical protein